MKATIKQFLAGALASGAIIAASAPHWTQACDACTNKTEIRIPEQAKEILKILHEHDEMVAARVKNKKLFRLSPIVLTMSVYARALPGKAPPDRKEAATNALTNFRIASKELLRAGILEKPADAAAQARRIHAALNLFDACFDNKPDPSGRDKYQR